MHDYTDAKCTLILQHIVKVMAENSVILIDDMVLPNRGASSRQMQVDLTMMAGLAAMERTEKQWYAMLDVAGLAVRQICTYDPELVVSEWLCGRMWSWCACEYICRHCSCRIASVNMLVRRLYNYAEHRIDRQTEK